ncbi:hypothetical protein [Primorskyibacter marinus]|uniref:hypothetical protein n=1 Tax=Primorskyibacter marinus TaxID=1977320 RepID=UPI0013005815|nr:hypothetical protein [Primorskyibacter marinus]
MSYTQMGRIAALLSCSLGAFAIVLGLLFVVVPYIAMALGLRAIGRNLRAEGSIMLCTGLALAVPTDVILRLHANRMPEAG